MMLKLFASTLFLSLLATHDQPLTSKLLPTTNPNQQYHITTGTDGKTKIQVVLLLDTSNSMDGLIDQAKAQLWKMVNKLADAKKDKQNIELEIALFEYGNQGLSSEKGFIRMVQPLGTDLDGLSEKLFQLKTNGGDEYCGWVIQTALDSVRWSTDQNDLKVMVIAGNEPFTQGPVDFRKSCENAVQKGVIINTIHCGDYATGVNTQWKEGADIGKGKYLIIDTGQKVVQIATPYDEKIMKLNERLNKTYLGYGKRGEAMKMRQTAQDANAASYGSGNSAQRAAAKSKASYQNAEWDVVDAAKEDKKFVENVKDEELPTELKGKNKEELSKEIEKLQKERESIQLELAGLEKQMEAFIAEEMKKQAISTQTLDNALIQTVVEQAKGKGMEFEK